MYTFYFFYTMMSELRLGGHSGYSLQSDPCKLIESFKGCGRALRNTEKDRNKKKIYLAQKLVPDSAQLCLLEVVVLAPGRVKKAHNHLCKPP